MLQQESLQRGCLLSKRSVREDWVREEAIAPPTQVIEWRGQFLVLRVQHEKSVKVLQVETPDVGCRVLFLDGHRTHEGIVLADELAHLRRQTPINISESQREREFVALAQGNVLHQHLQQPLRCLVALHRLREGGMLHRERREPIAQGVEEGVALHLREATEVDVGPTLLHIHHLAHRCL